MEQETKFKVGDKVIIQFDDGWHEPTDERCSFEEGMELENGQVGTITMLHHRTGDVPAYDVRTDIGWWQWHESALKKATKWRVKKLERNGNV